MPNPNAIVDGVTRLTPSVPAQIGQRAVGSTTVHFQSGRTGLLNPSDPRSAAWASVLDSLRQDKEPAYVEVDSRTNEITRLLCPLTAEVEAVRLTPTGDVEVDLAVSQSQHYLKRTNPDFRQLLHDLQTAQQQGTPVLVTETPDDHEVIDVRRPSRPFVVAAVIVPGNPNPTVAAAITTTQAQQMFDLVNAQSCHPITPTPPCIPFLFPDDGCWGRAHEMCRLMLAAGVQPQKAWIYGNLRVPPGIIRPARCAGGGTLRRRL
jgi:hypothetical protein